MMPDEIPPIEFPPGIDPDLSDLRHSAYTLEARGPAPPWGHVGGSDYRRAITADSPLKFAITYFPDWLCQENTWSMSFCRMHMVVRHFTNLGDRSRASSVFDSVRVYAASGC
jgi:hypothetical protein